MKKISLSLLFFANLFIIIGFWFNGSMNLLISGNPADLAIAVGRIAGLLAEFLILVLLILVSRFSFIEQTYGFDKLNWLHRQIGYYILIFIIAHPFFLSVGYGMSSKTQIWRQFFDFLKWDDVAGAFFSVFLFIVIVITSIVIIRRKLKYEVWHFVHLASYFAVLMALAHQTSSGDVSSGVGLFYWLLINYVVFGILVLYRFVRPLYFLWKYRFRVKNVVQESEDTYSVYINGRNMKEFYFKAGQFFNVIFLNKGFLQSHPFSFSKDFNGFDIRITVKIFGDYTEKIKNLKNGTFVLIDGPLGTFTEEKAKTNKFLLIAGGIGITPIRALAESLSSKNIDTVVLYGVKKKNDLVFDQEIKNFNVKYFKVFSEENNINYESGRIDEEKIKRLIPDFMERDIYICGPVGMMMSIVDILKNLKFPEDQLHYEKFSL